MTGKMKQPTGDKPVGRRTNTNKTEYNSTGLAQRSEAPEYKSAYRSGGPAIQVEALPPPSAPVSTYDFAYDYFLLGWHLLPVQPGKKVPFGRWGGKELGPDTPPGHWRRHPELNLGIGTGPVSGVFALDIDPAKGGLDTLRAYQSKHGPLPEAPLVRTGSGGWHVYFEWPADQEVTNSAGKLGPGLDVRGIGGYVVAPPSLHPNGRRYAWHPGRAPWDGVLPPPAPSWLLVLLAPHPAPPADIVPLVQDISADEKVRRCLAYVATMPPAISGSGGHEATFRVALACRGFDLDEDQALGVLREFNLQCQPRWSAPELQHKVRSAYADGRVQRGGKL
jgi:hypothetical protein